MKKNRKIMVVGGILLINFVFIAVFLLYKPNALTAATNFTLTDVEGNQFSLSSYNGRVVILSFVKTRCSSCRVEIAQLKPVYDKYQSSIVILSVSIDPTYDTNQQLLQFMSETGITWTVARGTEKIKSDFNVPLSPTIIIIDKSGYIQFRRDGEATTEELSQQIEKLL